MSYDKEERTSINLDVLHPAISSGVVNVVPEKNILIFTIYEIFPEFSSVGRQQNKLENR